MASAHEDVDAGAAFGRRVIIVTVAPAGAIVEDCQRVPVKHPSGLDSVRDAASGVRSPDRVPDLDLGITDAIPNQALGLVTESGKAEGRSPGATAPISAA